MWLPLVQSTIDRRWGHGILLEQTPLSSQGKVSEGDRQGRNPERHWNPCDGYSHRKCLWFFSKILTGYELNLEDVPKKNGDVGSLSFFKEPGEPNFFSSLQSKACGWRRNVWSDGWSIEACLFLSLHLGTTPTTAIIWLGGWCLCVYLLTNEHPILGKCKLKFIYAPVKPAWQNQKQPEHFLPC